jgi:Flp pilus assembly protein TadG
MTLFRSVKSPTRKPLSSDSGTATVELALVLPILIGLVLLGMNGALIVGRWIQANHWAAEAARYAAVGRTPGATNLPATIAAKFKNSPNVCIRATSGAVVGQPVTVTITHTEHFLPLLDVSGADFDVTATAEMRIERIPTGGEPAVLGGSC